MKNITLEIDYKQAHGDFALALANALGVDVQRVEVLIIPAKELLQFCCEYRVVNKCADVLAKVDGVTLKLKVLKFSV